MISEPRSDTQLSVLKLHPLPTIYAAIAYPIDNRVIIIEHELTRHAATVAKTPAITGLLKIDPVAEIKEGSQEVSTYEEAKRLVQSIRPQIAVLDSGDEHLFDRLCHFMPLKQNE